MARMIIELTNRCNLRCLHCFEERHAATGELPLAIIEQVLREGQGCGISHLAFTGGEPTLHRHFATIVERVCQAAYTYSLVSNGSTFPQIAPLLWRSRPWFKGVTFSLDGAREATHDQLRGRGSFRAVMRAASVCVMRDLPFTLNMVLTARNRHEVAEMVELAGRLGSAGVRFGWLMSTPETALRGLDLPPQERHEVEAEIRRLRREALVAVAMAPGYFSASPFFPCAPLTLQEYNLDHRGNLTLCCQLSGYAGGTPGTDVVGNLHNLSLVEAVDGFHQRVATYLADKRAKVSRGEFSVLDHFPCWYCVQYLDKVPGLTRVPHHPWAHGSATMREGASDGELGSPGAASHGGGRYGVGDRGNGAPAPGEQNLL
jgi:MoaA/NifB/PqqE/SkfB family radical SAM enzyme